MENVIERFMWASYTVTRLRWSNITGTATLINPFVSYSDRNTIFIRFLLLSFQVAGITANTEQNIAPLVPLSGPSPLQLANEPHMSIVASENAGWVQSNNLLVLYWDQ